MKVIKRISSFLLAVLLLFVTYAPSAFAVQLITEEKKKIYAQNGIIFPTDECLDAPYTTSASGSVGTVSGTDNASKIWNYFVTANIPGISDNAAAIAGIMGNFQVESDFDPFAVNDGSDGGSANMCTGLFQICPQSGAMWPAFKEFMSSRGFTWSGDHIDRKTLETDVEKAIQAELDFLTTKEDRFVGGDWTQSGWSSGPWHFLASVTKVTNKTPEAYADLWNVVVEGAINGESMIEDPVALSIAQQVFGVSGMYQASAKRRTSAREVFDRFSSAAATTTTTSSNNATISSGSGDYTKVLSAKNADKYFFNGSGDVPSAEWSDTDTASMKQLLETYGDLAYQLGLAVNVPYIGILVQMRYEDPKAVCGANNFWGNGCDPNHATTGGATIQGRNLGEGFMQYGQTVTNGYHNQAIGISDPKEYLHALAPTWIGVSDDYSEGYRSSVDALTNYINSAEGQAIVKTFGNYHASGTVNVTTYPWADGWVSGIPGLTKEDSSGYALGETIPSAYSTEDGKPNKIILHYTQGTGTGFNAFRGEQGAFPSHFIIDLKKKEGVQLLTLDRPSIATKTGDGSSVQIEIVGFGYAEEAGSNTEYILTNFSDADWDYLAVYLAAISEHTGIPLTTEVDWNVSGMDDQSKRIATVEEFTKVKGIVGHMHTPPNDDHTDPGNIWPMVSAAIARNPSASSTGTNTISNCNNFASNSYNCIPTASTVLTGTDITWIGDSYSVQAEADYNGNLISTTFPGVDFGGKENVNTINGYIQGSKHFDQDWADNPSGTKIAQTLKDSGKLRKVLVFVLGGNDSWYSTEEMTALIDKLLNIVSTETTILLSTDRLGNDANYYANLNAAVKKAASEHSNIYYADWGAVATPEDFGPDNLHLTGEGYQRWINTIKNALPNSTSGTTCPDATLAGGVTITTYNGHQIAFPIAGATKDMKSQVSELPCNRTNATGCHYSTIQGGNKDAAFDLCMGDNCDNQTVVSMTSGTITQLSDTRTHNGETAKCNHVRIRSEIDNTIIAYMHLTGENYTFKEGDHINAGDVIGHISPGVSACNDHSMAHVHIDKGKDTSATGGPLEDDRDPEIVPMMNAAYAALPANASELQQRLNTSYNTTTATSGLTDDQATKIANYYKSHAASTAGTEWMMPVQDSGIWNCFSFSAWWVQTLTTIGYSDVTQWGAGGKDIAHSLSSLYNLGHGTTPRPYAVFSVTNKSDPSAAGHTGIVVSVNGNEVTFIEAAYGEIDYTGVRTEPLSYFVNIAYPDYVFAYLDTVMDQTKFSNLLQQAGAK